MFCFLSYLIPPRNYNFLIPSRNYHNKYLCYYLLSQNREDFKTLESTFIPLSNHCPLSPLQRKPSSWDLGQSLSWFFIWGLASRSDCGDPVSRGLRPELKWGLFGQSCAGPGQSWDSGTFSWPLSCKANVPNFPFRAALGPGCWRPGEAIHAARDHTHGTSPLTLGPEASRPAWRRTPGRVTGGTHKPFPEKGHSRPT